MQTTAIILAGGKSKRMGTDKALLEVDGISLLEKSIALCNKVCDDIIISSNNVNHQKFSYPVIADEMENCGPMGGIYSCLKKSESSWNIVVSVDAAFLQPEFLNFLVSEIEEFDAVVPIHNKGKEPLIALYNKSALPQMKKKLEAGDFKMQTLLNEINTKWFEAQEWVDKYSKLFQNLNRPEDL